MAPPQVEGIDIYVRIKPVPKASNRLVVDNAENKIEFNIPRNESAGLVNNQREHFEFRFNGILEANAKQDEVFERVARPVSNGAMEGYNGTIFAYGQTGSGKTFTITGGPERYVDRGIIPRAISAIFSEVSKRHDFQYAVHISYLEIYNNEGYDLLDAEREIKAIEDLQQVIEENKALLKSKYDSAKGLGATVNDSKAAINGLRATIEQRRMQRAAAAASQGLALEELEEDPEETRCKAAMEQEKSRYKDAFGQLRELKKEIEHLHMLLEQSRTRLQRDFEQWMGLMLRQQQQQQAGQAPGAGPPGPSQGASPQP
ncbi:Kinesin-like protein KIF6, partial [Tetrabaena socialis]